MDENDESLVFVTFWDCRTHVLMTSSVERTDLGFKISVALKFGHFHRMDCLFKNRYACIVPFESRVN